MKKIKQLIFLSAFLVLIAGCDKDFVQINTNPYAINSIDLGLVFAGSQRAGIGNGHAVQRGGTLHGMDETKLTIRIDDKRVLRKG